VELFKKYLVLDQALRDADLTINFEAAKWFMTENKYDTYAQMYERGVNKTAKQVHLRDTPANPADTRDSADQTVLFFTKSPKAKAPATGTGKGTSAGSTFR
jgi:hypothetical protein